MVKRGSYNYYDNIIRIIKKIKNNKNILLISVVALLISSASLLVTIKFNIELNESSQESIALTRKSNKQTNIALNETQKLVYWSEPKPKLSMNSTLKWIGKNDTIQLRISSYNLSKGLKYAPHPSIDLIKLDIMFFNYGKAPLAYSAINIRFELSNYSKNFSVFPFKITKVKTPAIMIYYNYTQSQMMQTVNSVWDEGIYEIPYRHYNEKDKLGFPPSYRSGKVMYTDFIDKYNSIYAKDDWENQSGNYLRNNFGPFEIGTIESGEHKDIEIDFFACVEDFWGELRSDYTYTTKQKMFASGILFIEFEASNYKKVEYEFSLESYFNIPD